MDKIDKKKIGAVLTAIAGALIAIASFLMGDDAEVPTTEPAPVEEAAPAELETPAAELETPAAEPED